MQIKAKSAEAALQATHQIAASQEETNKELINMAQHILKSHTKKSGMIPMDFVLFEDRVVFSSFRNSRGCFVGRDSYLVLVVCQLWSKASG